jgi:hypothetical protein
MNRYVTGELEQAVIGRPALARWIGIEPHTERIVDEAVTQATRSVDANTRAC